MQFASTNWMTRGVLFRQFAHEHARNINWAISTVGYNLPSAKVTHSSVELGYCWKQA